MTSRSKICANCGEEFEYYSDEVNFCESCHEQWMNETCIGSTRDHTLLIKVSDKIYISPYKIQSIAMDCKGNTVIDYHGKQKFSIVVPETITTVSRMLNKALRYPRGPGFRHRVIARRSPEQIRQEENQKAEDGKGTNETFADSKS